MSCARSGSALQTFLAARAASTSTNVSKLMGKSDTSGICLVAMLDGIAKLPKARSPGKFYFTAFPGESKIFDTKNYEKRGDSIVALANESNPEEFVIKTMDSITVMTFEAPDGIEGNVGEIVKLYGFVRNNQGFKTCKSFKVLAKDTVSFALKQPVEVPVIDVSTSAARFQSTMLQFRSQDPNSPDWEPKAGNHCNITPGDKWLKDGGELMAKGIIECLSFNGEEQNWFLFDFYWKQRDCYELGVTNPESWAALGPLMLPHVRGFIRANIDIQKSAGLSINDSDLASGEESSKYVQGYSIWTNTLKIDLATTLKQCGTVITPEEVMDFYDEEMVLEYDEQAKNPLNNSSSLVKNLNEWTGSLTKVCAQESAMFFKVGEGEDANVFVVLTHPMVKKKRKR